MEVIRGTTEFYIPEDTVVSLGKFDGIHRGHERLVECLKKKKKSGQKTVIFTFDAPPGRRICGEAPGRMLTTNAEKANLFAAHGVDYLLECPFTEAIRQMEPEAFAEKIVNRLHVKGIVVGTDFRFGYRRRGDYRLLLRLADQYGYTVEAVDKVKENGREISSTYVREELLAGRIAHANELLGYCYFVQGTVVYGNQIGKKLLGVPTANLLPSEEKLLPPYGVYVTRTTLCSRPGQAYGGITNVGVKPTVEGENPVGIETHLFAFEDDIYGEECKVEFLTGVRPERRFDSLEELKQQMQKDIFYGINYYTNITNIC